MYSSDYVELISAIFEQVYFINAHRGLYCRANLDRLGNILFIKFLSVSAKINVP